MDPAPGGLSSREADRRLLEYGRNELVRRRKSRWLKGLVAQLTHPLALLLWVASGLSFAAGTITLGIAILVVIGLNAVFAFAQERQAEHAIEALAAYVPSRVSVMRDGHRAEVDAATVVPGDLLLLTEGDRVAADARLVEGGLEIDLSTLTGESQPVFRAAGLASATSSPMGARDMVFSGSGCVGGEGSAIVVATGMRTELGRIAALSEGIETELSPLERQVRRVAWLIGIVAVGAGLAFLPLGWFVAGLPLRDALSFTIGLIVANVPEGLLPTITLALAVGVANLARHGALVKRLSAVETLGSTTVICTDKTGTLTENRMQATRVWTEPGELDLEGSTTSTGTHDPASVTGLLARALAASSTAELATGGAGKSRGEGTEVGLLETARALGIDVAVSRREAQQRSVNRFDPTLRLMSTVDERADGLLAVHAKGAPEEILIRCTTIATTGGERTLTDRDHEEVLAALARYAGEGLRVIAVARRQLDPGAVVPPTREDAERDLCLLGLVALFDPPRPEVTDAVARCHAAGIRIIVVTGDYGPTTAEIVRRVGIGSSGITIVTGEELAGMPEPALDTLLREGRELIFARSSPEAKLRIADALRAEGHVVAMTGDGVNDAPALRRADIGVAMGLAGTEVAREAATMVLTDDNFATIVTAIEAGRRVYDNVQKFILYIFAHATPEVVPFLVFALSGGTVPLPLTVLQILAIDLGTEIIPALALGREPAEPGLMARPPRPRSQGVIGRDLLIRAWGYMGVISAVLVMGGFFYVLLHAGWHPGDDVAAGSPLHDAYREATTMVFAGIVACQIGTAFAARTTTASLRQVGFFTNKLLLWGIAFEIAFTGVLLYVPRIDGVFGTAPLSLPELAILAPFPFVVWGADELRRWRRRRGSKKRASS